MSIFERFEDVLAVLDRERARYVVVGGVALVVQGIERSTHDLDVVVDRTPAEATRVMALFLALGFVPTIPLPLTLVPVLRLLDRAGRELDVFARFHVPFDELFAGSKLVQCDATNVRVASIADIIRAKRLCGRPRDVADAERLEAEGIARGMLPGA